MIMFVAYPQVQLQLLTATVKLFLKKPTESAQRMIQLVLSCATQETDNPDLRDRAYVYWRLLSTDPEVKTVHDCCFDMLEKSLSHCRPLRLGYSCTHTAIGVRCVICSLYGGSGAHQVQYLLKYCILFCAQAAKDVVLAAKPVITDDAALLEPGLLEALLSQISSLASVYHKPADTFVSRQRLAVQKVDELQGHKFEEEEPSSTGTPKVISAACYCKHTHHCSSMPVSSRSPCRASIVSGMLLEYGGAVLTADITKSMSRLSFVAAHNQTRCLCFPG